MSGLLFIATVFLFFAGALSGFVLSGNQRRANYSAHLLAAAASSVGAIFAFYILISPSSFHISFSNLFSIPLFSFTVDALGAFFILLVCVVGFVVSIYAIDYASHYENHKSIGGLGFFYNLFILSMILTAAADNAVSFLVAWELMSVLSYFLVVYEHEEESARRAGLVYAVMTQIGTAFLLGAFLLLFKETGSFEFAAFRASSEVLPETMKNLAFVFALIGFGAKAGLMPLHIWLPEAHPAAPSHVSALMSGLMIKIAVYGLVRFVFDFWGGQGESWWGIAVLLIGALTALGGVLYAMAERDLKKFLAYSSIENIGIIFIAFGAALFFIFFGDAGLAGLAFAAMFYHILGHAFFKSLLFMGAGSVYQATGTKNMEKLGGLAKTMPQTAFLFLIGAMAVSALPALAGFVSEWLVFQGLLAAIALPGAAIKLTATAAIAMLALTSALVLAGFIKAFGITFLALPRTPEAQNAKEAGFSMRAAMSVLALLCLVFGVLPSWGIGLISKVTQSLGVGSPSYQGLFYLSPVIHSPAGVAPFFAAALVVIGAAAVGIFAVIRWGRHKKRYAPTWACGRLIEPRMEYTATGFAMPFRLIFSSFYRPALNIERETLRGTRYLISVIRYEEKIEPLFEKYLYGPAAAFIKSVSMLASKIQCGNINVYMAYIFIVLIVLLAWAARGV